MRIFLGTLVLIFIGLSACRPSPTESTVTFVNRDEIDPRIDAPEQTNDPLLLLVELTEAGNLKLNKIEVGTTANFDLLSAKLDAIYKDRTRAAIDRRDVVIEMKGKVSSEHFEKLIESLVGSRATPIRVIKGNL